MTTPLRRQYLDIKRRYPHAILFFRLGDFYETFDEDAEVVARELDIVLTSRPVSKGERVPLAGIPHHALDSYLAKLIARGYKVAICEQTEEPAKGKKLVDRQVVRVVTPGTLVEDSLLERGVNNYLAALVLRDGQCGIAHVDVSTGEFACLQAGDDAATAELERLRPAELLLPQGLTPPAGVSATLTPLPPASFNPDAATQRLLQHFGAPSLEGLGMGGLTLAASAAGAVLNYLHENQRAVLAHITRIQCYQPGAFMALDANTRRNLEIFDPLRAPDSDHHRAAPTLLSTLDHTKTPMGARLLRQWLGQPLLDITAIRARQDGVQFFFEPALRRGRVAGILGRLPDLERVAGRVSTAAAGAVTSTVPRDLVALRRGLESVPALREALTQGGSAPEQLTAGLHPCQDAAGLIASAIADDPQEGAVIRSGFSDELDALRATARDARQYLAELERRERERTGIKPLKVGYNRVFGYYIEVSNAHAGRVPDDYQRKQTLVGGERYTTAELREHEYRVLHAQELQQELEGRLLRQVCVQVAAHGARILETAAAVALIDVYNALAEAASRYGYVRPVVDEGDEIAVRDGRHPVVERMLPEGTPSASLRTGFVPNDTHIANSDAQVILLTGPNMAGKSTYLRQVALIVLMAQTGSFVPAAEARIGVVDRISSRVGALDDIAAGRSTFMVEMLETAAILHSATVRSLLIFDEIGRGTSTYDGVSLAWALTEHLHNQVGCRGLFATHYHELAQLAETLPQLRNHNVLVREHENEVVFLHQIAPGSADQSYGIHVARLAGVPQEVLDRARQVLALLEAHHLDQELPSPTRRRRRPRLEIQPTLFAELEE